MDFFLFAADHYWSGYVKLSSLEAFYSTEVLNDDGYCIGFCNIRVTGHYLDNTSHTGGMTQRDGKDEKKEAGSQK